ncbi:MAG TPA: hypothetical protein VKC60_08710, partial [Opitutaceae bacterium]|nr:hypothetical protein [Opitutaceae bacterium]
AAPAHVVTASIVSQALKNRPARPLFLIDLALPRDVDPTTAKLSNVFLYNLDDLAKIAEENRALREAELNRCRTLIAERAGNLWKQIAGQSTESRSESATEANSAKMQQAMKQM